MQTKSSRRRSIPGSRNNLRPLSFTEKVYEVTSRIPKGSVLTYKEVARRAGRPGAFRAVGNILSKNTDFDRVPCHRVVKSDGTIGGYAKGTKKKIELLKKEGVKIENGKVMLA